MKINGLLVLSGFWAIYLYVVLSPLTSWLNGLLGATLAGAGVIGVVIIDAIAVAPGVYVSGKYLKKYESEVR